MGPSRPREPWIYPSDRGRGHRRAHGGAPGRSPCSVQEFEGPSCAPKRSQRQHVNERVWLAALVTGHWGLPRAGDGGWMAESLDGHLQMRCLFSLLLGDGNVNTNSLSHQRPSPGHRGERSPRRNLFFAGPLSCFHLPSPSCPKALQHPSPSPSPIDRRGTPPSGGAILLHIPQLPSLFPHTFHPVRPTVLPFHPPSPTRCPASSVHCPLRCPLKTACWPRIEDGASGLLPDRETRSDLLASRRNEAPSCVFPFCISHHAVLSRYLLNCQEALRYAPASPLLEPPPSGPIRPRPRPRETKPRSTTPPPRRICRASALRSHIPSSTHCPPPPLATTTLGLPLSDPSRPLPFSRPREPRRLPMATTP